MPQALREAQNSWRFRNAGRGARVCTYAGNPILRCSIHSNAGKSIEITNSGNSALSAPVITAVTDTSQP